MKNLQGFNKLSSFLSPKRKLTVPLSVPLSSSSSYVRSEGGKRISSTSSQKSDGGVPAGTQRNVINLASNIHNGADIEQLLLTYGIKNAHLPNIVRPLAVVKVGGEVITKDLPNLVSSLKFLQDFGLFPVVIHGGGPQLNDELAKAGVKPEYIGGKLNISRDRHINIRLFLREYIWKLSSLSSFGYFHTFYIVLTSSRHGDNYIRYFPSF